MCARSSKDGRRLVLHLVTAHVAHLLLLIVVTGPPEMATLAGYASASGKHNVFMANFFNVGKITRGTHENHRNIQDTGHPYG